MSTATLRETALSVVIKAASNGETFPTGHSTARVRAVKAVRDVLDCGLAEGMEAVDWAIRQMADTNLDRCRQPADVGWLYRFPNGLDASVINDPHRPFRFEVCSKALNVGGDVICGLTSEQVEAKLHQIAALPAA